MILLDEFNGIYREHIDAVFHGTLHSVSRGEIAEEIVGEVFLTLYQDTDALTRDQSSASLFPITNRRSATLHSHQKTIASQRRGTPRRCLNLSPQIDTTTRATSFRPQF